MQVKRRTERAAHNTVLGLVRAEVTPAIATRGLQPSVRFFVDYVISVAVNSVARRQAYRTILSLSAPEGLTLKVFISTTNDGQDMKFVAYSSDANSFLGSSNGLFVVNETPRELENSIYLYLSDRLVGKESVRAEVHRETHSVYGLPVLEGESSEGPRSLRVRMGTAQS